MVKELKNNTEPKKRKAGAPLGNQNALGCTTSGRPPFDKKVEAEAFLKWALTEEALVLRMFAPLRGYSFDTMMRWCDEDIEFCQVYEMCKGLVGARRELKLINIGSSVPYQRYATYYDKKLQEHERDEKKFEANLSKDTTTEVSEGFTKALQSVFGMINEAKESSKKSNKNQSSQRNIDDNNINNDA